MEEPEDRLALEEADLPASFFSVFAFFPLVCPRDCALAGDVINNKPAINNSGITQRREAFDSMVVI
ncbi:MAG: hypothetical protein KTR29_10100 [Rhodothermaceae bacterium]|nr:hypothetical protein [Rhodothermaceae bacterium]